MDKGTKPTETGMNRTGIATSPIDIKEMLEGAQSTPATPDGQSFAEEHLTWARGASPVGTMPPPASLRGAAKTTVDLLQGKKTNVFLDLLGERLAFERTGTRLYEGLLIKLAAADPHPGGPTRAELERIRDEELAHLALVKEAIEQLGADPTVVTPSADLVGVAGQGWVQAVGDPRVTLTEALKVLLQAELVDNESWASLVELTSSMGHEQLAERFRAAMADEEEHLLLVRGWVKEALAGQAGAGTRKV
jgi:rubrerythrin